jgi:hypothetical protein
MGPTHFLWVCDVRDGVSGWCAASEHDHIPSVVGGYERQSQRVVLQSASKITHFLWVGDGSDGVIGWFCSYPARLRTCYGQAMRETESAGGSAVIQPDHVLPADRQWQRRSQYMGVQVSSEITYFLLAANVRN